MTIVPERDWMPVQLPVPGRDQPPFRRVLRQDPCAYCGGPGGTVDHIDPRARRGPNASENLTGCCPACNVAKKDMPLLQFLNRRAWDRGERLRHPLLSDDQAALLRRMFSEAA